MRAYKFRLYPSKQQEVEMLKHLWLAKSLWNELLGHSKNFTMISVFFLRRTRFS
ncbi:helix-turn-helix domain-containing protein [Candidatus Micrarchaeota archaeon]|nr:helix-turn-helix domain-containing protein [Candidatus Micrarchaeota archaeon]